MKIAIIGSTGLVGSRVTEILRVEHVIEEYNSSSGYDITNLQSMEDLSNSGSDVVIHFAAKADVDGCEEDKELGESGDAWRINVLGTENVARICEETGKKLIYISTDFVFDGTKPVGQSYTENDDPNPVNWYAQTKYEGERIVKMLETPWIIARIAYPYRGKFDRKKDFVKTIKERLENGSTLVGVTDHIMCPTFVDDIAHALNTLIKKEATGIFHLTGSEALSPFDALKAIAMTFSLDTTNIESGSRDEFFVGKASRPYNLAMDNGKITDLGVKMKTFEEGLRVIKNQL